LLIEKCGNILQLNEFGGNFDNSKLTAGVRKALSLQLLDTFLKIKKDLE